MEYLQSVEKGNQKQIYNSTWKPENWQMGNWEVQMGASTASAMTATSAVCLAILLVVL